MKLAMHIINLFSNLVMRWATFWKGAFEQGCSNFFKEDQMWSCQGGCRPAWLFWRLA